MVSPDVEQEENIAYFVNADNEASFNYFDQYTYPLFGSGAHVDADGDIFLTRYRDLPKEGFLPANYVQVSRTAPQATIFSAHSTYEFKELMVVHVQKDEGSVETAIRLTDHVLEGERTRESTQVVILAERVHELLDLFQTDFSSITKDQFAAAQERTYNLLNQVKLNPKKIYDEEKLRITKWVIKGSLGEDSLNRPNGMIATMALSAAYRHAIERLRGIGIISGKFVRMREALIFEREFNRALLTEIVEQLSPHTGIPTHTIFRHPDSKLSNIGPVIGKLNTMRFQLGLPRVKPYRTMGRIAEQWLADAVTLLQNEKDQRQVILEQDLFGQTRGFLKQVLYDNRNIYPSRV